MPVETDFQVFLVVVAVGYIIAIAVVLKSRLKAKPEAESAKSKSESVSEKTRIGIQHIRYAIYATLLVPLVWFIYWGFIYDCLVWHKNIYQTIECQPYNIFYLFICTLALLTAHILFTKQRGRTSIEAIEAEPKPVRKVVEEKTADKSGMVGLVEKLSKEGVE